MSFPKPTPEELKKIKKMMLNPDGVPDESIGVVHQMMADNRLTSYNSILSGPILKNFEKNMKKPDGTRVVPLMMNHPSLAEALPLGTAFDVELKENTSELNEAGQSLLELYGKFYTIEGKEVLSFGGGGFFGDASPTVMETKDIGVKYSAGQIKAGSIGFATKLAICSVCETKLSYDSCDHELGKKYEGKLCYAHMGVEKNDDTKSDGRLKEYSILLAGAVKNAGAVKEFSYSEPAEGKTINYQFSSEPSVQRQGEEDCGKTNLRTGSSTQTTQKEHEMETISIGTDKYEEFISNKLKLADGAVQIEELTKQVTELQADKEEFSANKERLDALTAEKKLFDEGSKGLIESVIASGIKAYGADKDENAEKYAEMTQAELFEVYEKNIVVYCDALTPGEHTQNEGSKDSINENYSRARSVAAGIK